MHKSIPLLALLVAGFFACAVQSQEIEMSRAFSQFARAAKDEANKRGEQLTVKYDADKRRLQFIREQPGNIFLIQSISVDDLSDETMIHLSGDRFTATLQIKCLENKTVEIRLRQKIAGRHEMVPLKTTQNSYSASDGYATSIYLRCLQAQAKKLQAAYMEFKQSTSR